MKSVFMKRRILCITGISFLWLFLSCGDDSGTGPSGENNTDPDNGMTWSSPVLLEDKDLNVHAMDIDAAGNGRFVAVWGQDEDGSMEAVYSSTVSINGDPSASEKISGDVFSVSDGPEIDLNNNGSGLVVWGETKLSDTLNCQRSLSYYPDNGYDLTTQVVYSDNINPFLESDVHVDDNGNAVFAGDLNTRIWSASFSNSWSDGDYIDDNSGNAFETVLAGNSGGFAAAVWEIDGVQIFAAVYDGSAWSAPAEISVGSDNDCPDIAVDENQNVAAVWNNSEDSYYIYAAIHTNASGWGSPVIISSNSRAAGADPQICFDGNGNAVAVWEENDGFNRTIYANRYTTDNGWGTNEMIGNLSGEAHDPQIAVNSAGKAVVIWEQEENGTYNMYSAQYLPVSGSWTAAELLETDNGNSRNGRVAIDEDGYAAAVWNYDDGSNSSIKAAYLH